jgi:hypothetical protein
MGDQRFQCQHCRKLRLKRSPEQRYCGSEACQRARKNCWRQSKLREDPEYCANQRAATQAWLESQGGSAAYYRRYRKQRRLARGANKSESGAQQASKPIADAKSDAETAQTRVKSGTYRLVPCDAAKSDAIMVELSVISVA